MNLRSSVSPTNPRLTSNLVVGTVTIQGRIVIKPQGFDEDGWQITVVDSRDSMELLTIATKPGCPPQLSRRLLGSRHTSDWSWKLIGLPGTSHEARVKQTVALVSGRALTEGDHRVA